MTQEEERVVVIRHLIAVFGVLEDCVQDSVDIYMEMGLFEDHGEYGF